MRNVLVLLAASAMLALVSLDVARAAPGDAVVPAHRTHDGHWVPANVPPVSGGTHLSRRPGRSAKSHRPTHSQARSQRLMPPLLVEAQSIRR